MSTTVYLVGRYVDSLKARRCSTETVRTARYILLGLANRMHTRLDLITPADIAEWQTLRAGELGGRTLRSHVSYVRMFYQWAVLEGHVADDPTLRMRVPRVPLTLPRPVSEERLEHALDSADPTMAALLGLAAFAGLRACEIAGLTWGDLYLDDAEPVMRVLGKGERERICDVSVELRALLLDVPGPRRGPVIRRGDGGPGHNTPNRISKIGNAFLHDHGVPDTLHSLRHRFITQIARLGGIHRAREAAGHASISTTAVYAKVLRSEVRPLVEQVGRIMPTAS